MAKKILAVERAEQEYAVIIAPSVINGITGRIATMWKNAESLLFTMSQVDKKMGMKNFWEMSVYDFLRYKQLLTDYIKRTRKGSED